jgi:ectoine hydroxylase-related dioxygenase (phytanoyl-CoA dioxygenase family)
MGLTRQDIESFNQEGFLVIENALSPKKVEEVLYHLSVLKDQAKELEYSQSGINLEAPGGGFYSQSGLVKGNKGVVRAMFQLERKDPFFAEMSKDSGIYNDIIQKLVQSQEFLLASSNYWGKPAKIGSAQPWHQDLAYLAPEERSKYSGAVTIWIALDPANKENGCLEFYPGSHKRGDLPYRGSRKAEDNEQINIDVESLFPSIEPKAIELEPGSAVCFGGHVVHGSKKNSSDFSRQAISFGYVYK